MKRRLFRTSVVLALLVPALTGGCGEPVSRVIPDFAGSTPGQARAVVAGLPDDSEHDRVNLRIVYEPCAGVEQGTVFKQSPGPGSADYPDCGGWDRAYAEKLTVTVWVAQAVKVVPDVLGMQIEEAEAVLTAAGYLTGYCEIDYASQGVSTVVDQYPASGTEMAAGETVYITTPRQVDGEEPPAVPRVPVPSVVGMSVDCATTALHDAGLRVDVRFDDGSGTCRATAQDPVAGTLVDSGSTVLVYFEPEKGTRR